MKKYYADARRRGKKMMMIIIIIIIIIIITAGFCIVKFVKEFSPTSCYFLLLRFQT
jgi:flagellar basal body-associated protein FliL